MLVPTMKKVILMERRELDEDIVWEFVGDLTPEMQTFVNRHMWEIIEAIPKDEWAYVTEDYEYGEMIRRAVVYVCHCHDVPTYKLLGC